MKYTPLLTILLTGCAHTVCVPTVETVRVEVPVAIYPSVTIPPRPNLDIDLLKPEDRDKPGIVANAYRTTIVVLRDYARELELLLQAVNKQNTTK